MRRRTPASPSLARRASVSCTVSPPELRTSTPSAAENRRPYSAEISVLTRLGMGRGSILDPGARTHRGRGRALAHEHALHRSWPQAREVVEEGAQIGLQVLGRERALAARDDHVAAG